MDDRRSFDEAAVLDHAMDAFWEHGFDGTAFATCAPR
jgi:hypothetical protein